LVTSTLWSSWNTLFIKTAKKLKVQNRELILSKPNSEILGLLLMSRFDKIISIEN
jgi:DNA-binding winged helix-turn-helix (wHTH) protein